MKIGDSRSFLRIPVIYGILNTKNLKWYIGSCLDMKDRFERHRYYLRHNMHHSDKLQRAYNLYGEDTFEVQVLYFLSNQELKDRFTLEQQYIEKYNSVKEGYNMLEKCVYVDNFSLSETAREHFLAYIKTLEMSVIAINRSTGQIDNTFESITKAAEYYHTSTSNISRVCKGTLKYIKDHVFVYTKDFDSTKDYKVENYWKGRPKSDAQKEKMRHNRRCCTIYQYTQDGELVHTYYSINEAAICNNMSSDALRHKINKHQTVNGFIFSKEQNNN